MDVLAYPAGLLDLVGAKSQGKGLSQMADALAAVVTINDNLGLSRRLSIRQSTANTLAGVTSVYTVPTSSVDRIIAGALIVSAPAASSASTAYLALRPANFAGNIVPLMDSYDVAASSSQVRAIRFQDFLLGAGDEIVINIQSLTGGPIATYFSLLAEEYRA
jgi:hypothetical protein